LSIRLEQTNAKTAKAPTNDAAGASCAPIAGAVASTYVPGTADSAMRITVTVTATNSVSSKPVPSAPTNPVS